MEDSVLKLLEAGTDQDIGRLLKEFNSKYEKQFTPVSWTSDICKRLWKVIMSRLKDSQATQIHQTCLDSVRILSRDKSTLNDVIDQERLAVIVRLAGLVPEEEALQNLNQQINYEVVAEAQKCLSNLVFQSQAVQKWCCVNSCIPGLMCRLKTFRDPDLPHLVKYFDIRLLFLLTATCPHVRPQLRTEYHGLTYLIEVIDLILNSAQEKKLPQLVQCLPSPIIHLSKEQCDLVMEVLKVLYNLFHHIDKTRPDEEEEGHCLRLSSILRCLTLAKAPTQHSTTELHRHTVNLLMVMPALMYEGLLTDMPYAAPQLPAAIAATTTTQPITTPPKACPMPSSFDNTHYAPSGQIAPAIESDGFYDACEYDGKDMSAIISILNFLDDRLNAVELFEWRGEDLSPKKDGGILRRILKQGEGFQTPNEGAKVEVKIIGRVNGTEFDNREVKFPIGEGTEHQIPEGLERALERFKNKEKSVIKLQPKYGFGSAGLPEKNVPPGAELEYEVELTDFTKSKPGEPASENLTPVLTLLIEMVQVNRTIRKFIRLRVLPPLRDVTKLPEEGNALRNKLCLLMTSPLHEIKYLSANFLFILCKESVDRLIKYTGYGNAAGLLASRGLMLGGGLPDADYSDDSEDSDTEEYEKLRDQINPVTGRYEPPRPSPFEGMSDEQKEHETMKLVNVLDKLARNNIIQPCKIGEDGKPQPVSHVLELQENLAWQHPQHNHDEDDDDN